MNKEFNYKANIYHRIDITVLAEDKENADRILKDTINSVEDQYKYLFEQNENIRVQDIKTTHDFYLSSKNREVER